MKNYYFLICLLFLLRPCCNLKDYQTQKQTNYINYSIQLYFGEKGVFSPPLLRLESDLVCQLSYFPLPVFTMVFLKTLHVKQFVGLGPACRCVIGHVSVFVSSTRLQPFTVICRNKLNKEQVSRNVFTSRCDKLLHYS